MGYSENWLTELNLQSIDGGGVVAIDFNHYDEDIHKSLKIIRGVITIFSVKIFYLVLRIIHITTLKRLDV